MVFISLSINEFKNCIDAFKSDKTFYKTVSEISVSNAGKDQIKENSCIYNKDIRMISLDDVVTHCTKDNIKKSRMKCRNCETTNCKGEFQHSSVDAIYVKFNQKYCDFFLFEFKSYDIKDPATSIELKKLSDAKKCLSDKDFKKIKKKLEHSDKCSTKLKAYESVYSIIPQMYVEYCIKKDVKYDVEELKSFLFNCKFSFYLVYNYENLKNPDNKSSDRSKKIKSRDCNNHWSISRIRDFSFHDVDIIMGQIDFEETFHSINKYL